MTADYGVRAAVALDRVLPGPHRDKTVARLFNVSVRTAQYLRGGKYWTIARLSQASALLGVAFDAALCSPITSAEFEVETADFDARLSRVEARLAQMVRSEDTRLAPLAAPAIAAAGGSDHSGVGVVATGSAPRTSGAAPQPGGETLARARRADR